MPSLNLLANEPGPRRFPLFKPEMSLGRSKDADIHVDDAELLEIHALIACEGSHFTLTAASRKAQLSINGKPARTWQLGHGDRIEMGSSVFIYQLVEQPDERLIDLASQNALEGARLLVEYAQHLLANYDVQHMLESLIDAALVISDADKGMVILREDGEPRIVAARNVTRENLGGAEVLVSDPILERVLGSGRPLIVEHTQDSEAFRAAPTLLRLHLASVMCLPLMERGEVLGALYLGKTQPSELFHVKTLEILTIFAVMTALLVRAARVCGELALLLPAERAGRDGEASRMIASSRVMQQMLQVVRKVAPSDVSVLITGETGTGKELVARELHRLSRRHKGPMVVVNCGAIPAALLESLLFGHEAGAYTDAGSRRGGAFHAAHGGTLLLDEIGELPLALQVRLLRVLEERQVTRVGAVAAEPVDVRIIAATQRNLAAEIRAGRFREDLYWRLNPIQLEVPPLRERGVDRVLLARYFVRRMSEELGMGKRGLSPEVLRAIRRYGWPGNVRELEQRIRGALVLGDSEVIEMEDLGLRPEMLPPILPLGEARERYLRRYVEEAVERCGGDREEAARQLRIEPRTLARYLKGRGEPPRPGEEQ